MFESPKSAHCYDLDMKYLLPLMCYLHATAEAGQLQLRQYELVTQVK